MAQRKPVSRSSRSRTVPVRSRRRGRRALRRLALFAVFLVLVALASYAYVLNVYDPGLRSEVDTIPARVHAQLATEGASYVAFDQISPYLRQAIVAIEDRRFYEHPGIDPLGILRALWVNFTAKHVDQGGSTLEEQLVKRMIVLNDRSIHEKIRTMALAWAVDQEFSKQQILEFYLNAAYYGRGAYGATDAARVYFGTDAAHLSIAQAAFLAALPQAPSIYGAHPRAPVVVNRYMTVLQDMENLGYITPVEEQQADTTALTFAFPNP